LWWIAVVVVVVMMHTESARVLHGDAEPDGVDRAGCLGRGAEGEEEGSLDNFNGAKFAFEAVE
jgi:hypothetical protein